MIPALWPGETIRVERANPLDLRAGDVAVVDLGGQLVVHRILETRRLADGVALVTRGDAQRQRDMPVRAADVIGVATAVRRRGCDRPIAAARSVAARRLARLARALQATHTLASGLRRRLARILADPARPRVAASPPR